jgi:hypothetical protein
MTHFGSREPAVSPRLLRAALVGLLAVGSTFACSGKNDDKPAGEHIEGLDAAGFQAMCDARGGTVEVMAHCGGLATAAGFSYDTTTETLIEHSCKGQNTCAGWNCVLK